MSTLKQQGVKAFIWDFSGKMANQGMGFVVSIFLARLLEPSDFGLIAIVMVIIGIASIFSDIGLGGALIQRRRVLPVHYSSVFYFNISVGLLLSVLTFFLAPLISGFYENEQLLPLMQALSPLFVINALSSVQSVRLRKELNYALLTKIGLVSSLISGVIGVSLAFVGAGVWSLVAQALLSGVISNILLWTLGRWRPKAQFSFKALMQLWAFGFRMFLSGFLDRVFSHLDTLIIGKLFSLMTLGFFNRAKSLNQMVVTYSSGSLMTVLFPVLSKVQRDLQRFQNIVLKSLGIISFVVFLLLGGFYLVSEELIVLLFGAKWLPSVEYFQILVMSGFGYPVSALLVNVLSSRGNSKAFLRLEIYKKLLTSVNLSVLYFWGIDAFLYGLIVMSILGVSLNIVFASREINVPFFQFAKPVIVQGIISIVSVIIVLALLGQADLGMLLMLIVKGALFVIIYLFISIVFNTMPYRNVYEQIRPYLHQINRKRKKDRD